MPQPLLRNKPFNVPQALVRARELHRLGRLADAERLYAAVLAVRPDNFDALHLLGLVRLAQARHGEALQLIASAMRAKKPSPEILLNYGLVLNALNRHQEALENFEQAIKLKSKYAEAHNNRGVVLVTLGRCEEAMESYRKALAISPHYTEAHSNRGNALMQLRRFEEALASYDRALAVRLDYAEALFNRGNALDSLKRFDEALASYDRALSLKPDFAGAHCNRGNVLRQLNRLDEALASYDRALTVHPDYVEAHFNRGNVLETLKRVEEALLAYDRTLVLRPKFAGAHCNRGNALRELKRFDEALVSYDRAIALQPDLVEAHSNRGMILHELKRRDEALASYDRALALHPDYIDALNNRGTTLQELKRFDDALATYDRLLALNPHHPHGFSGAASCAINVCDWDMRARLAAGLPAQVNGRASVVSCFALLGYSGDPALQLQCARNYLTSRLPSLPQPLWTGQRWRHDKIRIAYLSADFRAHATAFLMAELFERHDRSRFEIIGISFSTDDGSNMRQRLVVAFDEFHDVQRSSDKNVAQLLQDREVDIAIDLKGYTQDSRPEILAHRPVPIQVSYLGYPGTMGAPFIDYILADKFVAPFEHQPFYTEKIVHLPGCYQANDSKRVIAELMPTRQQAGLPDRGFVFCSFNNNWKIAPDVFDVWMRLLQEISGSVLWLLRDNDSAEHNLRKQAAARGIDPSRLVFADRAPPDEHLARHRLADLFLDTLPCNAHTTASDALWAGLPVLTCTGESFSGRVATSLLHAVGLPELAASSLEHYRALALQLARDPALLVEIKATLVRNRSSCELFNSERFSRHVEAAYTTMWERWQRGEPPDSFGVAPFGS